MTIQQLTESPYIYFNNNPLTDSLLNNKQIILDEFTTAAKQRHILADSGKFFSHSAILKTISKKANDSMYSGSFKSITLYMTNNFLDEPEKIEANWQLHEQERFAQELLNVMPWTQSFILENKNIIGSYNFNISYPGSRLVHHLGLDANYIRLHYCIKASPGCVFDIEGWTHEWKDGELFGFDDGNVFHGTTHANTIDATPRIILIVDVLKSYLKPYAKTWPCRIITPSKDEILKYHGTSNGTI
jgi:aspartyl/asparaginyl beta-hydroxylase (cupin superfamily)